MDFLYIGGLLACSVVMWAFVVACKKLEDMQWASCKYWGWPCRSACWRISFTPWSNRRPS